MDGVEGARASVQNGERKAEEVQVSVEIEDVKTGEDQVSVEVEDMETGEDQVSEVIEPAPTEKTLAPIEDAPVLVEAVGVETEKAFPETADIDRVG